MSLAEDDAEPQSSPSTTLDVALDTVSDDLDRDACPVAVGLLRELRAGVERIPASKPEAAVSHRLSAFSGDPSSSEVEIQAGDSVMKCKVHGCETVWVRHIIEYVLLIVKLHAI